MAFGLTCDLGHLYGSEGESVTSGVRARVYIALSRAELGPIVSGEIRLLVPPRQKPPMTSYIQVTPRPIIRPDTDRPLQNRNANAARDNHRCRNIIRIEKAGAISDIQTSKSKRRHYKSLGQGIISVSLIIDRKGGTICRDQFVSSLLGKHERRRSYTSSGEHHNAPATSAQCPGGIQLPWREESVIVVVNICLR